MASPTLRDVADLVRIPRVPILSTGTYQLSTGEFTFTLEDLHAAAAAPAIDAAVQWPRIKIDGLSDSFDQSAHGGEPAWGRVEGMVVEGETLYGDYVIPPGLAAVIDWGFPGRSVEGMPGSIMGPTATGKTHELIITAVALLGVDLPGVSTLPDLMDLMATFGGVNQPEEVAVMATIAAKNDPVRVTDPAIRAGLDQELVRRRFFDSAEGGEDGFPIPDGERGYDLWIRSLRFDDDGSAFLVVEAWESGRLYRYGFAVSGNDVTFNLIGEVVEQYVAASAAGRRSPVAVWATRDDSRAVMASQEATLGMTEELRRTLAAGYGLDPDTATEADITAAATAAAEARAAEQVPDPDPAATPEVPAAPVPVAASTSDRTVTVTREQWETTQTRLAAAENTLAASAADRARDRRDGLVMAAMQDGRLSPVEAGMNRAADGSLPDGWRRDLDEAPEVTERLLARLERNRVPVQARGITRQEGVNSGNADADHGAFMAGYGGRHRTRAEGVREVTA